jgi:putative ABC transport system permease protein
MLIPEEDVNVINAAEYYINIQQVDDIDAVMNEINALHGNMANAVRRETLITNVFTTATQILLIPMSMIGLLFIEVTFLIVYSICRINVRKEGKTYGIYKSLGMTARRVRGSVTQGIVGVTLLGSLLGILVAVYLLPPLLSNVTANYGVVDLPFTFNIAVSAGCVLVVVLVSALSSWLSSIVIKRTSARTLSLE